jgi:hypothetical protein
VIDPDDRGLVATLVQAYRSESVATLWHHRVENLVQIFDGPWRQLLTFDLTDPQGRRVAEFFDPIFTLGWWGLGLVALAGLGLAAWRPGGSNSRRHALGPPLLAAAWCALTLAVWALLMFLPRSTVVHQGSYVSLLLLLTVGALGLWRLHPLAFAAAALAQAAVWPWIWFPLPIPTDGTPAPEAMVDAIVLGGLAVAAMVAIVAAARGQETASVDPAPA